VQAGRLSHQHLHEASKAKGALNINYW